MANPSDRHRRLAIASQRFTPGSPIDTLGLFAGRQEQLLDILGAYHAKGQHVALYGERGVGKTSIASILAEVLDKNPKSGRPVSTRIACNSAHTFENLWQDIFRKLELEPLDNDWRPTRIHEALCAVDRATLVIIDEMDRLDDDQALSLLADTIKLLSDEPTRATLILVGVADSVEELVGEHESINRSLRQIQMPRMSPRELAEIVTRGMEVVGLSIGSENLSRIASLSEGLPHYTHALALYSAERAIADDRDEISLGDIEAAISTVVRKSQQTILSDYNKATRSSRRDALFEMTLLACALAKKNDLAMFAAKEIALPLSLLTGKQYDIPAYAVHLRQFSGSERANVLQQHGTERRYFYRFRDPMMQPFIILNGITKGLISEERLKDIKQQIASG